MKYIQALFLSAIILFQFSCSRDSENNAESIPASLGQIQSVWTQKKEVQENFQENALISQEHKELFDISNVFQKYGEEYDNTLWEVLQKYKISLSTQDIETIKLLLSQNLSTQILQQKISEILNTQILESDIEKIKKAYFIFADEKNIQKERLWIKEDFQTKLLINSRDTLINTLLEEIISSRKNWSEIETQTLINEVLSYFYHNNYSSEIESFTDIIETLEQEYELTINTESIISNSYDFNQGEFMSFMQYLTESYETSLSYNQHIEEYNNYINHQVVLENIILEASMIESEIPLIEYQTLISENITQLESIYETQEIFTSLTSEEIDSYFTSQLDYSDVEILYQERVQNDDQLPNTLEKVLHHEFKDDSELIQEMSPIAYVQDISGQNVIITNLAGGYILANENDILYAGYTISTESNSQATIIFSDESILRLEENSEVTLIESSSNNMGVDLKYGNIWTRVIKPLFTQDSFEIKSEGISLAVRGTSLYIEKEKNSTLKSYIVDSYIGKGSSSVELTHSDSGEKLNLSAGDVYILGENEKRGEKDSFTRKSLMQEKNQVSEYLRKDLQYISLTLDDRNRGFYNNPISDKNDSQNFINKLTGELETSLPNNTEVNLFFKNTETPTNDISVETIYLKIMQDDLITKIKNGTTSNASQKINTIINLDTQKLTENLGNYREIENRIDLNISNQIIETTNVSDEGLQKIFTDFGLSQKQANISSLKRAQEYLSKNLNNGSPFITEGIDLLHEYEDVQIYWISSNTEYISDDGVIQKPSHQEDIIFSMTAVLKLGDQEISKVFPMILKKTEPSDQEKLLKSYEVLLHHIDNIEVFSNNISLPDFNEKGALIPEITWSQDTYVNKNGTLNRPDFTQGDVLNHVAKATLTYGNARLKDKEFILKKIKKQPQISNEVQDEFDVRVASSKFPDCNAFDIELSNGQIWSMCNVGSQKSGFGTLSYGDYFLYQYDEAIEACSIPGYQTPSRNDWLSALESFNNDYNDFESIMKLPKSGYEDLYFNDTWKDVGTKGYFWTSEKKSGFCTSNCGYAFHKGDINRMATNYDRLSVRCIKDPRTAEERAAEEERTAEDERAAEEERAAEDESSTISPLSLEDIAENTLNTLKENFELFFTSPILISTDIQNIDNLIDFPEIDPKVKLTWSYGTPYIGEHGNVFRPSFNTGDKTKNIILTISHEDTQAVKEIKDIEIKFKALDCDGKIIDSFCYTLVAEADYNTPGDYNLKLFENTLIAAYVSAGVSENSTVLDDESRGIKELDGLRSQVKVGDEIGVYLDNKGNGDSLSYDLSPLELGDDWVIEMSVRGEDLQRGDLYYLLAFNSSHSIFINNGNIQVNGFIGSIGNINPNKFYSLYYTYSQNKIAAYLGDILLLEETVMNIDASKIYLGSSRNQSQQWNGILNKISILK